MTTPYPPDPNQPQPPQYGQPTQPSVGYPTPPPKKSRRTLWIVLGIVGGLLVLCCGGGAIALFAGGKAVNKAAKDIASAQPAAPGATGGQTADQPKGGHAKQGQAARDGKFEFTVTGVTYGKDKVGADPLVKTAQGQFVMVALTIKNIGTEPKTFAGLSQKAIGAGGVTYTDDTEAEIYANTQSQTFLENINPGNQVAGTLVFDIPKDAKLTAIELHDSPFSGGVTVDLT